jgi:CO2 hydration protein
MTVLSSPPLPKMIQRLEEGKTLLPDTPENLLEVVGILKSYGHVLDAYWRNLLYISEHQFLVLFPFYKYFNGEVNPQKLMRHWWHDRINYEFSEYCMKAMFWHGGGGLDTYLDTPEFAQRAETVINAKLKGNFLMQGLHRLFPGFLPEVVRQMTYYSVLGQFWEVMSPMFLVLYERYERGEITNIPQVVDHILAGLVAAAAQPISYQVNVRGTDYVILPADAGITFLADAAVPYVEAVFLRSFPFMGTVSYNAQARQIPTEQGQFNYGALYADPLPIGGAGIPPTLLMQDMRHYLPDELLAVHRSKGRGETDLRVKLCVSFQKSMFCVTNAAIVGLAPHSLQTQDPKEQKKNRAYLSGWMERLQSSRLLAVQ